MENSNSSRTLRGAIVTACAGIFWGFSGTCAQYIFQHYDTVTPIYLTSLRMLFAGIILMVIALAKYRSELGRFLKNRKDTLKLVVFSIFGIMFSQITYLETISYTNSGTATILQYTGPVGVMVISCFMARRLPSKREVAAVILTVLGVLMIATRGNITTLYITPIGLAWGALSAVALILYTMIPVSLIREYGSIPVMALGMSLGGIVMVPIARTWEMEAPADGHFYLYLALIIVVGTVLSYTLYLTGVGLCGAVNASLICSIEPVSATVCMVVWLGEPLYAAELFGFVCIFTTIFLLSGKKTEGNGQS